MKTKLVTLTLACLALSASAADWTLASGAQDASTTMTDGTATLKVVVLDAAARTLRLGNKAMTDTAFAKNYPVTGADTAWELDFSKPITLAGSNDPWTIVEVCPWAFCNTKNVYAPASGLDLTSVTNIGAGAFMYCQGFTKILLSTHLAEVGHSAFNQCFKTVQFVPQLPPSLKRIGHGAFAHHTRWDPSNVMQLAGTLELLGLEEIHGSAFNWLPGVTNILVGSKLSVIDKDGANVDSSVHTKSPFRGLNKLQAITFFGPAPASLPDLFLDDRYDANDGVQPDGSSTRIAAYADAGNEKVFARWTGGNGNRTVLLALLEGHPASETEPQFDTAPTLVKSGSSLLFEARLSAGRGALSAVFTATDGTTEYVYPLTSGNEVAGDADETPYTLAFDLSSGAPGLPQDRTYSFAVRGENDRNEVVTKPGVGTFFFGEVDVAVDAASASENGGTLAYTVSRTGTDGALTVPLAFSGTAAEFTNFRETTHTVTIADGASSASFAVEAVVALDTADTTLAVAASPEDLLFVGDSATATISDWAEPQLSDFSGSLDFTVAGSPLAQADAIAHFPVLVRIPASRVASIGTAAGLAFFQDAALLPHEVDTWSAENGALVWVGMDALYTNAVVTCAWGKEGYVAPNLAFDLWREAGYIAVWHLGETADGAVSLANSTVVGAPLDGTASAVTAANAAGAVGAARPLSATPSTAGRLSMPPPEAYLELPTRFTASFWVNQDGELGATRAENMAGSTPDATHVTGWVLRKNAVGTSEGFYSKALNSSATSEYTATFSPPRTNEWVLLSVSFDNAAVPSYQVSRNGETRTVNSHLYGVADTPFAFGNVHQSGQAGLTGAMDEIRLRKTMSTAAWLAAETATVKDPGFLVSSASAPGTFLLMW